jgi:hypothetical protein
VTAISKEKCETLIKMSQYLEVDEWPKGINFTYGGSEIEELAEQFGLSGRHTDNLKTQKGSQFLHIFKLS